MFSKLAAQWNLRRGQRRGAGHSADADPATLQQVRSFPKLRRLLHILLTYLVVVGVCVFLDAKALNDAEQYAYNLRMSAYGQYHEDIASWVRRQIVLVPFTDDTFDPTKDPRIPGPPLPRHLHARVIRDLTRAGAKVIVFDIIFDQKGADDAAFVAAARAARGRVLWACAYENEANAPHLAKPHADLWQASPHQGLINSPQDVQRPIISAVTAVDERRIEKLHLVIPGLGVNAALMALGLADQPLRTIGKPLPQEGSRVVHGLSAGNFSLPLTNGKLPISYLGKPNDENGGGFFASVPYEDVCDGAATEPFYQENQFFKDKIVIIGDATTMGNDFRYTPVGGMPGMEIQAHAAATVLAAATYNELLREAPPWANLLLIAVLAAVACRCAASWRLLRAAIAMLLLLIGYIVLNIFCFVEYGLYFHLLAPALAITLATLGISTERGLLEEREKNWMRSLLQRYVSPQVAAYIVTHPNKCVLGGEQVTATVLFSDIRGFSKLSRENPPALVVALLNEYLQTMTDVVFRNEGTVDKYVGDAIMAVFGVPVPSEDHARRAVATALEMQNELQRLQARWQERGWPIVDIGIGINTGSMIAGNMGSRQRLDFTVVGDSVNLAAHIEDLNKEFNTRILISAATYQSVQGEVEVGVPRPCFSKGGDEDITVYELIRWHEKQSEPASQPSHVLASITEPQTVRADTP